MSRSKSEAEGPDTCTAVGYNGDACKKHVYGCLRWKKKDLIDQNESKFQETTTTTTTMTTTTINTGKGDDEWEKESAVSTDAWIEMK